MAIEFGVIKDPKTCINNSFTLASYELNINGVSFPLCGNYTEELIKSIGKAINTREEPT